MATKVNEEKIIKLFDGTEVKLRPLKVSLLRPFMKKFDTLTAVAEDSEKSIDVLLECVQIAFRQYKPELAEDIKALEDLLDLPTMYAVVQEASGSPNQMFEL